MHYDDGDGLRAKVLLIGQVAIDGHKNVETLRDQSEEAPV